MALTMQIPFVDLHAQYLSIKAEIDEAIATVIRESSFIRGPHVDAFESAFATVHDMPHCISCANGTDSLYIAMHALGVKPGDEVIVPAHSWISTSETVTQTGATVVFCDTDPKTHTLNPDHLERLKTSRTVGIIPVHLYGHPADMDPIMAFATKHKLWVLEDCAQAHLARYKGRLIGTFGTAASFSFYPGKNLGAMGDAGALLTRDPQLALRMAMFARHGGLTKGDHLIEGINSRMDGLQAAILNVKLKHLPRWTMQRQLLAHRYNQMLACAKGISLPLVAADCEPVWHLYVIQHDRRDLLAKHLAINGVSTVVNYPVALPFLPAYSRFNFSPEHFPVAFTAQSRILSIPIYPELAETGSAKVIASILDFTDSIE
jgi:dTDP-4-amino-4,6-dideoxygalactose transaminase